MLSYSHTGNVHRTLTRTPDPGFNDVLPSWQSMTINFIIAIRFIMNHLSWSAHEIRMSNSEEEIFLKKVRRSHDTLEVRVQNTLSLPAHQI